MKLRRCLSIILTALVILPAALAVFALGDERAALEETEPFLDSLSVPPPSSSSTQTGVATIESDPSRLSAPGYVNVIIKLRNTNSASTNPNTVINGSTHEAGSLDGEFLTIASRTEGPIVSDGPEVTPVVTDPPVTPVPAAGRFTHISITNPYGVSFETSDVNPGTVGVFRASMMVYDSMIGETLSFTISWYDTMSNLTYSQTLALVIHRSDTAYLRLSRTASRTNAAMGDEVVFTYSFVNTGARRLTNIRLTDDKILGTSRLYEPFSLASGERKDLTFTYTMQGASVVSKPTATFTPEGSATSLSVTVSKLTIGLINAQLSKSVNVGTPTPEGVTFTLFMTNNGSRNLSSLTVKDDLGAVLASGFSLAIGESKIIEHFVKNPSTVRNVVFYITGSYDSDKDFADNTQSYTVRPYINPALLGLRFRAEVKKQLDSDSKIVLTFTVENTGRLPYSDIVLTEEQLGYTLHEIKNLAVSSDPVTFDIDLTISEPRELVFVLTALDPSGNPHSFDAHINAQRIDVDPAIPNQTPAPGGDSSTTIVDLNLDKQINEKGEQLKKVWRVLGVVFILALIAIAVLAALEYRMYRRRKNNEE